MKCLVPKPLSKKDKKELNELVYKFCFGKIKLMSPKKSEVKLTNETTCFKN